MICTSYESQADFIGWKNKQKSFLKNPITKNQKPKQCHLPALPIPKNFRDWFLGKYHKLMRKALMLLNLYGRQAIQRKLKKGVKTQKMHFYPFFGNLCLQSWWKRIGKNRILDGQGGNWL
jgi:hypothetical protein